jgi:hypothetical protein
MATSPLAHRVCPSCKYLEGVRELPRSWCTSTSASCVTVTSTSLRTISTASSVNWIWSMSLKLPCSLCLSMTRRIYMCIAASAAHTTWSSVCPRRTKTPASWSLARRTSRSQRKTRINWFKASLLYCCIYACCRSDYVCIFELYYFVVVMYIWGSNVCFLRICLWVHKP